MVLVQLLLGVCECECEWLCECVWKMRTTHINAWVHCCGNLCCGECDEVEPRDRTCGSLLPFERAREGLSVVADVCVRWLVGLVCDHDQRP
jgi:hypothetical protein